IDATVSAAAFLGSLGSCCIDEDAPHRLGRGGEEMATTVPVPRLAPVHQPQIGLMDQGRRAQRPARLLLSKFLRRQLAEFIVDEWQELLGGARVALLDGGQYAGNVIHLRHPDARKFQRTILARVRGHGSEPLAYGGQFVEPQGVPRWQDKAIVY